ncbi:MAG: TolB family protein [Actinomycetota bacterium]
MALDERLRTELERAARPADPTGVYEDLIRRRERRRIARRVQGGVLALVVVVGSIGGFLALNRIFRDTAEHRPIGTAVSNGLIAYAEVDQTEDEDGIPHMSSTVWVMEPDGSERREIARISGSVTSLEWSPDGRRLAVSGDSVWTMNADGTDLQRLTAPSSFGRTPTWSPDGTQIALSIDTGTGSAVAVMEADGTNLRQLTEIGGAGWPDWSPGGRRIAFVGLGPEGNRQGWDIYVMNADGTGIQNLTNSPTVDLDPDWSPGGDRIVFRSRRDVVRPGPSDQPDEIYVMNPDGTGQTRLTDDIAIDQSPIWSPVGSAIAFTSIDEQTETTSLIVIKPDGSARTVLLDDILGIAIAWQPVPSLEQATPSPSLPDSSPTVSPSAAGVQDIGLGFPVCGVTSVSGVFAPGVDGTAFVATRAGDTGGCPQGQGGFEVVAVDITGDGLADASYGPLECDQTCSAFAALDVDGDGTDELLVQNVQFSIAGLNLFEVHADGGATQVVPVTVAPPGTAAFGYQGFEGGAEPQLWLGGDAGASDAIRCEPYQGGRAFVSTTAAVPVDAPGDWDVAETWFVLEGTELRVVDVNEFAWPVNDDVVPFLQTGGCGADLDPSS